MTRRHVLAVTAFVFCGAIIGTVAARVRGDRTAASGRKTVTSSDQISLTIAKTPSLPGEMLLKAKVTLGFAPLAPQRLWWFVEIRGRNEQGRFENILVREYDHQAFHHDFQHVESKTFEDRLTMPPGEYVVFMGLRDDSRFRLEDGTIESGRPRIGHSILVTVL
jgi:hypothetical protein